MRYRFICWFVVADGHEVPGEELVVLAADVDETFPDDLIPISVARICDECE